MCFEDLFNIYSHKGVDSDVITKDHGIVDYASLCAKETEIVDMKLAGVNEVGHCFLAALLKYLKALEVQHKDDDVVEDLLCHTYLQDFSLFFRACSEHCKENGNLLCEFKFTLVGEAWPTIIYKTLDAFFEEYEFMGMDKDLLRDTHGIVDFDSLCKKEKEIVHATLSGCSSDVCMVLAALLKYLTAIKEEYKDDGVDSIEQLLSHMDNDDFDLVQDTLFRFSGKNKTLLWDAKVAFVDGELAFTYRDDDIPVYKRR